MRHVTFNPPVWLTLTPTVRALSWTNPQPTQLSCTSLFPSELIYLLRSAILVAQTIAGSIRFHAVSGGIYI
jgi:hypothetical protein